MNVGAWIGIVVSAYLVLRIGPRRAARMLEQFTDDLTSGLAALGAEASRRVRR